MCAICPECNEVITFLNWGETKHSFGSYDLKHGFEEDSNSDIGGNDINFNCPECDSELFTDEWEAEEFLKNVDKLKEIVQEKANGGKNGMSEM